MFDWSAFFYSSTAGGVIGFLLNRAYDEWKSQQSKQRKINALKAVTADAIISDLFLIKHTHEPSDVYITFDSVKSKLSSNIPVNHRIELHELHPLAHSAISEYYRQIELYKIELDNTISGRQSGLKMMARKVEDTGTKALSVIGIPPEQLPNPF